MSHSKSLTVLFLALAACLTAQAQTPTISNITNVGTSTQTPIAPGAQMNINGSNLGDASPVQCANPVPTVCGGVTVLVNGKAALVRSESAQLVSFYAPVDLTGTGATVQVTRQTGGQTLQSAVFSANVAPTAPGIFTTNFNGQIFGNFQDSTGANFTPANPAKVGDFVRALGTGFGVSNPPAPLGTTVPNSPAYNLVAAVKVTVGGQNAIVSSATIFPGGLGATAQATFQVPPGLTGGNLPVVVNVGGVNSQTVALPVAFTGPRVTSVVNSASNAVAGLPNAGVAPGSILVAYGNTLGPDTLTLAPGYPWPATLAGTSAQITVGGKTTSLLLYYTSANQIAGLLPSSTLPGTGTITVTYNGQTGGSSPITVLANNFGVYTVPQNGSGPGIVTFADYSLVSTTRAANPGETLIIWGTGLGAVTGGDEAAGPLPGDMTNLPVQVWVGGVSATVVYRGRSGCCVGEDQIAFVVPPNITGCYVPLAVQINSQVSNFSTMAVAPGGRACVPSFNRIPTSATTLAQPRVLIVEVKRVINPPQQSPNDPPSADRITGDPFKIGVSGADVNVGVDGPNFGSCMVVTGNPDGYDPPILALLDGGPTLTLKSSGGATRTIGKSGGGYSALVGDASPGNFLDPGTFTLSGTGGADFGAFTTSFSIPSFSWTNRPNSANPFVVNRSQGIRLNWTGGDPNGYVQILGGSGSNPSMSFFCQARTSDGTFTVPPYVLSALPSSGGNLSVFHNSSAAPFTVPGLDYADITNTTNIQVFTLYQ